MSPGEEFFYQDKKIGDTEPLAVFTSSGVFHPTATTVLLLRAARRTLVPPPHSVLDLGCGCGIVSVVLAKLLPPGTVVCASDVSAEAVRLTELNTRRHGLRIECRRGSLFEPWAGRRFDFIVEDVAGVAEPLARLSGWYPPPVPSEAGRDGTRWVIDVLDQAADHLTPGGRLYFPVLTLSREERIVTRARARFATVTQVEEQWYPLSEHLLDHLPLVEELAAEGSIRVEKHGSRWCWATKIYLAERGTS